MSESNQIAPEGVDSFGARLRIARERAGLSLEEVSTRLKMPIKVIRALEEDDWTQAGAPVFVRGQLRSYARLLGLTLDLEALRSKVEVAPPELVSHTHTPRYRRMFDHLTRRAVYIAITAVIVVPVWLATRPHLASDVDVQSLEVPVVAGTTQGPAEPASTVVAPRTPVIASMGSLRTAPVEVPDLALTFAGDSWVQVFAPDGRSLEQGLLSGGERRVYEDGQVGRIVLGNASAVEVRKDGKPVDLGPFSRANVARFTLSSDGSLAPVAD